MAINFSRIRRWLRFSTRTLLLIMLVLCMWFAYTFNRTRRQEELVRRLIFEGRGEVAYHHSWDANGVFRRNAEIPGPAWLRRLVGDQVFLRLRSIGLYRSTDDDLRLISEFDTIEILQLDEHVRDEGMKHVARMHNLKELTLGSPYLTDRCLEDLSHLQMLEKLWLTNARVTDEGIKRLAVLSNLKELELSDTQVTAEGAAWLRQRMPDIEISGSFPSAAAEREIVQQLVERGARLSADKDGYVEWVTFWGREIRDDDLSILANLKRLRKLLVYETRVTFAGIEMLRRVHPKLEVYPEFRKPLREEADAVAALNDLGVRLFFDATGHVTMLQVFNEEVPLEALTAANRLGRLKDITLVGPDLPPLACRLLAAIRSLESISIEADLDDPSLEQLAALPALKDLRVGAGRLTPDGFATLAKFSSLQKLDLRPAAIEGHELAPLADLVELSVKFAKGHELTDEGLAHLVKLKKLRRLMLIFTELTDDGAARLVALSNLERLSVENSKITDAGLLLLAKLPKLKQLGITHAPVTPEGVAQFKKLRPDCRIISF